MPDHRPTQTRGGERLTLLALLQFQRESFLRKVEDLDDAVARRPMVPSGTSLLWLTRHLSFAESIWLEYRFAGLGDRPPPDSVSPTDTVADAARAYRETWDRVDAIVATADLEDGCRRVDHGRDVNLRWILAHLLEETARHAGHADILREMIDGATGR